MKRSKLVFKPLPVVIAAMFFANPVQAGFLDMLRGSEQEQVELQRVAFIGKARVRQVSGKVEILRGIEEWKQLKPGTALRPGDIIRTANNSLAILEMSESGSLVRLTPNASLRLITQEGDRPALVSDEGKERYVIRALRGRALVFQEGAWKAVQADSVLLEGAVLRPVGASYIDVFDRHLGKLVRVRRNTELRLKGGMEMAEVGGEPIAVAAREQ